MFRRNKPKIESDFRNDIPEYSDEKIIEILKLRNHYLPEATKMAIDEAIKRGIIYSEQDLFSEEYKVEEHKTTWFPQIRKPENRLKIRKSIARSFVICGVIPAVYGLLQTNAENNVEGSLIFLFGLLWIYFSFQLIKAYHNFYIMALIASSVISVVYIYLKLLQKGNYVFFDFFLPTAIFLLCVYGLLFIKRIHK